MLVSIYTLILSTIISNGIILTMLVSVLQSLLKWQPKPLRHNQFATLLNDRYQISSQFPSTITEIDDNSRLLVKADGKIYIYCNGILILRINKNVSTITIGILEDKSKIIDIRKNIFRSQQKVASSSHQSLPATTASDNSSSSHDYNFSSGDSGGGDCGGGSD